MRPAAEQTARQEEHDQDENQTGERAAEHCIVAGGERIEQRRHRRGADRRPEPVARAAKRRHQDHVKRRPVREGFAHRDIGDEDAVDAAGKAGERARQREGAELEAIGRHAHHLRDLLVVVDGEQTRAEARVIDRIRDPYGGDREDQRQHVEAARDRRGELRHRHRRQHHAGSAVDRRIEDDGGEDERQCQGEHGEELTAQRAHAEDDRAERRTEQHRQRRGKGQRPHQRPAELAAEHRRRVDPGAEERGVAEGEVAGVAAEDVPRRGKDDRVQQQVEERFVEGRQSQEWNRSQCQAEKGEAAGGAHQNLAGRKRMIAIKSENDTSGAHVGAVTAIVSASLTPMRIPAASGPMALPSPPIMTAANTTPIHA